MVWACTAAFWVVVFFGRRQPDWEAPWAPTLIWLLVVAMSACLALNAFLFLNTLRVRALVTSLLFWQLTLLMLANAAVTMAWPDPDHARKDSPGAAGTCSGLAGLAELI